MAEVTQRCGGLTGGFKVCEWSKENSMILSYETLFVYHSINEINIAQFGKMTSKTLIFSSPIYTCIFYIFKNLYLLFMNISS